MSLCVLQKYFQEYAGDNTSFLIRIHVGPSFLAVMVIIG